MGPTKNGQTDRIMKEPEGNNSIQPLANNLRLYNMEAPFSHHCSQDEQSLETSRQGRHTVVLPGLTTRNSTTQCDTWILERFELCNINRTLKAFIQKSMRLWKIPGIYQRDAVSPLLFCIGLNFLS